VSDNGKKPKLPEPLVEGTKIKVFLSPDEWLIFETQGWLFSEYVKFSKAIATEYMEILLRRLDGWQLRDDTTGAFIEFNRDFLIAHMENLAITPQKQTWMITAYYRAYNIAATLDLEKK
jgi:hypothetical protein